MYPKPLKNEGLFIAQMGENMQWKDGGDDFELVEIQNAACEYDMELAKRQKCNTTIYTFQHLAIWIRGDLLMQRSIRVKIQSPLKHIQGFCWNVVQLRDWDAS